MKHSFVMAAVFAVSVASAHGQSVPDGQSCGGLLCDMGVWGHKTEPSPAQAPPPAVVPAPIAHAETSEPVPKRRKTAVTTPKKRPAAMAKAVAPTATVSAPVVSTPITQKTVAPPPAAPAARAAPVNQPAALGNPYASGQPSSYLFQPIDPRAQ